MVTLTYGPQEFAGQLSSYAAEGAEYRWYIERVPDRVKRLMIAAYGAYDLAIGERDAVRPAVSTNLNVAMHCDIRKGRPLTRTLPNRRRRRLLSKSRQLKAMGTT